MLTPPLPAARDETEGGVDLLRGLSQSEDGPTLPGKRRRTEDDSPWQLEDSQRLDDTPDWDELEDIATSEDNPGYDLRSLRLHRRVEELKPEIITID